MHHARLAPGRQREAAVLEHLQHRRVVRQARDELIDAGACGDRGQMAQKHGAETPSLVLVDHGKGRFGASGLQHDVAPPAKPWRTTPTSTRLGAYECGALNALLELMDEFAAQGHDIVLKAVTGVSIGSINVACVVGAKTRADARARLDALWDDLMLEAPPFWMAAAQRDLAYLGCLASIRRGRISGPRRPGPMSTIPARC